MAADQERPGALRRRSARSLGRLHSEPRSPTRDDFQRDRDRIIHSTASAARPQDQVFVYHEGDHFRSRLTHTSSRPARRALAKALALDEELAERWRSPRSRPYPFGHTGEDALDACMASHGGFDHNSHGLRLVTELERRYADFDGLNSRRRRSRAGQAQGPLIDAAGRPLERWRARGVRPPSSHTTACRAWVWRNTPALKRKAAAIADDIAYDAHDIDDGLRAELFEIAAIRAAVPFVAACSTRSTPSSRPRTSARHPRADPPRHHPLHRGRHRRERGAHRRGAGREPPRTCSRRQDVIGFSPAIAAADREIKTFLFANMYRHPQVTQCARAPRRWFGRCSPLMSPILRRCRPTGRPSGATASARAHAAADYIAGMTDRFALNEYRRLLTHGELR